MPYQAPGLLQGANQEVLDSWNTLVQKQLEGLLATPGLSRAADHIVPPNEITSASTSIHWPADPAEPRFCLDENWAQKLSDWGVRGRQSFQNEYCEYAIITRVDGQGRVRLKRFTATTELAEWWLTVATHDPCHLKAMAEDALGRPVAFEELYGAGSADPHSFTPVERRTRFAVETAGNGNDPDLADAGVPAYPRGAINRENALFMFHPINGLDDLIYIVVFGAQPYVVEEGGQKRLADLHEIFDAQGTTHLACRNADPAAAQGAFDEVLKSVQPDGSSGQGCKIAFADPIGMYFHSFQNANLSIGGQMVPEEWTRFSRGVEGLFQRLEFGPPDTEDAYIDEIIVNDGASTMPLIGGYQLAKLIEVGPRVLIGDEQTITPNWFVIPAADAPDCSQARVCSATVEPARQAYEAAHQAFGLRGR